MSMNGNGQRSPEEIQADIERTRAHLDETLTAIEHKLAPSQLIDQGVDYLRHSGAREYVSNLGESAKQEPIPLALVGIGLAWLMLSGGRSTTHASSHAHVTSEDLAAHAKGMGSSVSERAHHTMDSVRGTMSSTAESMRSTMSGIRDSAARTSQRISDTTHRIGETAHAARERASQMSAAAREQAIRMRHGYDRVVHDHPLALGAIGLAVGAVLAATAPRTRREDRLMGHASERLKENVSSKGREQLHRADEQLDRAMSSLGSHAEGAHSDSHARETAHETAKSPAAPARAPGGGMSSPPDRSMH